MALCQVKTQQTKGNIDRAAANEMCVGLSWPFELILTMVSCHLALTVRIGLAIPLLYSQLEVSMCRKSTASSANKSTDILTIEGGVVLEPRKTLHRTTSITVNH